MNVEFAAEAAEDLISALLYVAEHNPMAAETLRAKLLECVEQLAADEFEGREEHLASGQAVRSFPMRPYRIYYERRRDAFVVVRIYHQARHPITK